MNAKPIHLGPPTVREGGPSEGRIQDEVVLALSKARRPGELVLWRNNLSTALMPDGSYVKLGVGGKGAADLIGIYRSRFIAVEMKRPGQKQRPEQVRFQQLVESIGGTYVVIDSVEGALNWLEEMRRKYP
jgi:hypothetical protein